MTLKSKCCLLLIAPLALLAQQINGSRFIENKGQWDPSIKFAAQIPGGRLNLHDDHLSYSISNHESFAHLHTSPTAKRAPQGIITTEIEVDFVQANAQPIISYKQPSLEYYNFYYGNDPSKWGEGCKAYSEVTYKNLYPDVDLKFYYEGKSIKYDLIIKPHADPSKIKFRYRGDIGVSLEEGCVNVQSRINTITENKPVVYQQINGSKLPIQSKYLLDDHTIQFAVENYDSNETLIIDPELIFSTFSGTVSDNFGYTACFDNEGNLYSGGIIFGPNFDVTNESIFNGDTTDIAILKYDSTGSYLLYATFLGGTGEDAPHSLIVDHNNQLVILGTTGSSDYPVSPDAYDKTFNGGSKFEIFGTYLNGSDIVLTKLGTNGNIVASTYVGGEGNDGILKMDSIDYIRSDGFNGYKNRLIQNYGDFMRGDVNIDEFNNIYVASSTESAAFPIKGNIQNSYGGGFSDAVAFSLNSQLTELRWSTYLGGSEDDAGFSIKLDANKNVFIGGGTLSSDYPTTAGSLIENYQGSIDGFITKIDQVGDSILQSTYLGTPLYDQAYFIDIDENQNVFAFGQTRGNYPITPGSYANPNSGQFIHQLNNTLDSTIFSTVFGSGTREPNISPTAFLANECGNLFISGWGGAVNRLSNNRGYTSNLPITENALFPTTDGSDFYIMVLSADGKELLYATYFGGYQQADHVDGGTSRFDKRGIIYQAVCSCGGKDDSFPTTPNAWSTINRGVNVDGDHRCNNAAFKFDLASLKARFETNRLDLSEPGYNSGCIPLTVLFTNQSTGGEELLWTIDDGTERTTDTFSYTFETVGTYQVTLRVTDVNTCQTVDEVTKPIFAFDDKTSISNEVTICRNDNTTLHASGGGFYTWSPATGLNNPTTPNPVASPDSTTTYKVAITTPNGCFFEEEVTVNVIQSTIEEFDVSRSTSCKGSPLFTFENKTDTDASYFWDFGDGNTAEGDKTQHIYEKEGEYFASLVIDEVCVVDKTISVYYQQLFIPNVFSPNGDLYNDYFEITTDLHMDLEILDRTGKVLFIKDNYQNDWDGNNLPQDVYYYSLHLSDGDICNGWVQILK